MINIPQLGTSKYTQKKIPKHEKKTSEKKNQPSLNCF